MSLLFKMQINIIKMFIEKQNKIKYLIPEVTDEFILEQKNELEQFQKYLEDYKHIIECNKIENYVNDQEENKLKDEWYNINYGK